MVIGPKFTWAHLPKTGGTITARVFAMFPEIVSETSDRWDPAKHSPLAERPDLLDGRILAMNIRRLPSWTVSWFQHRSYHGFHPDYHRVPVPAGDELAASTIADEMLGRFTAGIEIGRWLRQESVLDDALDFVGELTTVDARRRRRVYALGRVNEMSYEHNVGRWLDPDQVEQLYASNPLWASVEKEVYGDLLSVETATSARAERPGVSLPDFQLRRRVGAKTAASKHYEQIGKRLADDLVAALPTDWSFAGKDVLDFGAGAGRVVRHLLRTGASARSFVATDIDGPSIEWLGANVEPPFEALRNDELPPLPFEDARFDLIYAFSVFTHLAESEDAWLEELHRVARPGAHLLLSFNGPGVFEQLRQLPFPHDEGRVALSLDAPWERGGPLVFHNEDYVRRVWGERFVCEEIRPSYLSDYQDLAILRR
jgi:SAM-dependent methyltransferase